MGKCRLMDEFLIISSHYIPLGAHITLFPRDMVSLRYIFDTMFLLFNGLNDDVASLTN